jgi:OmcA/MtrC family decaheme c-type cytochrome
MRIASSKTWTILLAPVLVGSVVLISAPGPRYSTHDKAFYADENLVNFVRPGLKIEIQSASIAADGTISTQFKLTDPKGLPLDKDGVFTPGEVGLRFIAAYIKEGQTQYTDYVTRTQTSPDTGVSATQAADENNGTFTKIADGEYKYTFKTKAPADFDKTVTHTIGITASRDLEEFDLGVDLAATTFNFVPDGSAATVTRDVIKTVSCNKCHGQLRAHGETGRTGLPICILCHQPQTIDPDTGNTVDMKVMAHKIHMGADLPSVIAGTPYVIIGHNQGVNDFSTVEFPADVRRCTFCHEQDTGADQATAYLKPSMTACGACHDNVNFATGQNHVGGPQISNKLCAGCHIPLGELEFDSSVIGAHTIPEFSSQLPGVVFELLKVDNGAAGQKPTITFSIKDKTGNPTALSDMDRVRFYLAGPTTDYPSDISENALSSAQGSGGIYTYTFQAAIPADAKGSWAIGVEGRRLVTLNQGLTNEKPDVRDLAFNKIIYFSVDGSPVQPRRKLVALDIPNPDGAVRGCNSCHAFLSLHGGNRNNPELCVFCHNPNRTAPADEGGEGINFPLMVHRIHTGEDLVRDYIIGNTNFKEVRYPDDRRRCDHCHVDDGQQVPSDDALATRLDVTDPLGLLNPVKPVTAACTACHGEIHVASHALAMTTTQLGEACRACHGPDADFSINKVHADEVRVSEQP